MGNCCGSEDKNFASEGRTLGAQPANAPARSGAGSAAVPPKISGAGRTLAGKDSPSSGEDARSAAARAAEERAKASTQGRGKLGKQLDAQRGQSQANALAQTARDNVAARDADAAAQARNYN